MFDRPDIYVFGIRRALRLVTPLPSRRFWIMLKDSRKFLQLFAQFFLCRKKSLCKEYTGTSWNKLVLRCRLRNTWSVNLLLLLFSRCCFTCYVQTCQLTRVLFNFSFFFFFNFHLFHNEQMSK